MPAAAMVPARARLAEWLDRIARAHPLEIELGLERASQVAARMGIDAPAARVVTVGGTNGKGSCVAVMERLLLCAGKRVGAYTSPHLQRYNERVRIAGRPVDDETLCAAFAAVEQARDATPLTYFEFGTLAALEIFRHAELDFLLLEVGLGGRLDAVNIIDADVAVISSIQIDHVDWLGHDREAIGFEKAGILRAARPVVCGDRDPPQTLRAAARALDARWFAIGREFDAVRGAQGSWNWRGVDAAGSALELRGLASPQLLDSNVATALQALALCGCTPEPALAARELPLIAVPGRFQKCRVRGIEWVLDVAHNPAATAVLASRLVAERSGGRTAMVFAAMADKDIDAMLKALLPCATQWFLPQLGESRAARASELAARIAALDASVGVQCCADPGEALENAMAILGHGDRLVVCGSFHAVGPALDWLDTHDLLNGVAL